MPRAWRTILILLLARGATAQAIGVGVGATAQAIGVGVKDYAKPLVVKRQVPDKAYRVPAPWLADETAFTVTADTLKGNSAANTILRFAPTIKGPLVSSEQFGDPKFSAWWNNGATLTCFCPHVHDLAVDGRGQLHPHPYVRNSTPDIYGPDAPTRGDGICLQGTGALAERLRLFQIQGTALVVRGAPIAGQSGQFGLYDEAVARINDVSVLQCINGIDCNAGDARISRVSVSQVAHDGLTVSGPGTYVSDAHVWGADRSVVFGCEVHADKIYAEAARIGLHVLPGAANTTIRGLNIGPSTCSSRGALIEAFGVQVDQLSGTISGAQAVGCELGDGAAECYVAGRVLAYNGATAFVVRGHHHTLRVTSQLAGAGSTAVKLLGPVSGTTIEVVAWGAAETTVLDLSQAQLGSDNEFRIRAYGAAQRVAYPGADNNLPTGNQLTIDGVAP